MKIKNIFNMLILSFIVLFIILTLSLILSFSSDNREIEEKINIHRTYSIIPTPGNRLYPEGGFNNPLELEDSFFGTRTTEQTNKKYSQNYLQLYHGIQGGIYYYDAWLDIEESGEIYIRVFYLGTNIQLSENSIKNRSTMKVYNTNGEVKRFSSNEDFTIYEGNWGDYYGVRVELWYISDRTKLEEKILEDYYIVEGWER